MRGRGSRIIDSDIEVPFVAIRALELRDVVGLAELGSHGSDESVLPGVHADYSDVNAYAIRGNLSRFAPRRKLPDARGSYLGRGIGGLFVQQKPAAAFGIVLAQECGKRCDETLDVCGGVNRDDPGSP
jgi:hypothetical protein